MAEELFGTSAETQESDTWGLLLQSFILFHNEKGWASIEDEPPELIFFLISATKLKGCESANLAEISVSGQA